jgi:hypothetical protein
MYIRIITHLFLFLLVVILILGGRRGRKEGRKEGKEEGRGEKEKREEERRLCSDFFLSMLRHVLATSPFPFFCTGN